MDEGTPDTLLMWCLLSLCMSCDLLSSGRLSLLTPRQRPLPKLMQVFELPSLTAGKWNPGFELTPSSAQGVACTVTPTLELEAPSSKFQVIRPTGPVDRSREYTKNKSSNLKHCEGSVTLACLILEFRRPLSHIQSVGVIDLQP